MSKTLLVVPERCNGCKICLFFCFLKQKALEVDDARLKVLEAAEELGYALPVICRQYAKAPCEIECPRKAIIRDRATGALKVDKWDCVQCGLCISACPFGMISYTPERKIVKCDLCGGSPICAQVCPTQAILYTSMEDFTVTKRKSASRNLKGFSMYVGGEE